MPEITEPTQAELDQPDVDAGGTTVDHDRDSAGNPAEVADDQEPVSRYDASAEDPS